jgi:hypothetical protein
MCWSLEVSVGTSVFSYAVALFLIVRGDWTRKFYGGCLLGVCAMQWAEAWLWYHGDLVEQCAVGGANRFGTQVLVRLALMMQPLGPFFSAKAFAPRSFSAWLYVPFPLIVHAIKPVAYTLVGDNWPLGSWWHVHKTLVHCTTPTPMGYLNWGAEQPLALHLVWTAYIAAVPLYALRGSATAIAIVAYGTACLLLSWAITDSVGSNWCLYVSGYSVCAALDYCFGAPMAAPRRTSPRLRAKAA